MFEISQSAINQFQQHILDWYALNKRALPWRKSRDPYHIFISEVMSQQTQINRVIPKYEAWISELPTISALHNASISHILRLWSGLGYNRRALNMKKTAEILSQKFGGKFPQNEKTLLSLPGIGQYTARAILCFAFNQQVVVIDTNIRKVILTQFLKGKEIKEEKKLIENIAAQLLPQGKAYEWNQALMDYAGTVLKKEKISIPKQSAFVGSHRYYRGKVLKTLLDKKRVSVKELGPLIKKEYSVSEEEWLKNLVSELQAEGFIIVAKDHIYLSR